MVESAVLPSRGLNLVDQSTNRSLCMTVLPVISIDFTKSNSGPLSLLQSIVATPVHCCNSRLLVLGYVSTSVSPFHMCFSTKCSCYLVLSVTVPQSDSANTAPSMASTVVPQYYINYMDCYLIPQFEYHLRLNSSCPKVLMTSILSSTAG